MRDTVNRFLSGVSDPKTREALRPILYSGSNADSSQTLTTAGLAIHGAASALVKTGAANVYLIAAGVLVKIASGTDLTALAGSVTNAKFNVFCFFCDASGNVTVSIGTEGATLAAVAFPPMPVGLALLGFVIINPTGAGPFVGGTTALDDATVVPNAVYISPTGAFDPSSIIS